LRKIIESRQKQAKDEKQCGQNEIPALKELKYNSVADKTVNLEEEILKKKKESKKTEKQETK
jgi:hypothetical protein